MPPPWTPEIVAERLVAAYRRVGGVSVLSSSAGGFSYRGRPLDPGVVSDLVAAFRWPDAFVRDPADRRILRTWASCRASRDSVRERYRALGWGRGAAERRRARALAAIADGLNGPIVCQEDLTRGPTAFEPAL